MAGNEVKVVLLGESGSGKTCIVSRFVTDEFQPVVNPTIGAAFTTKTIYVEERTLQFSVWDTSGQERYAALAPMYYRNADAALLVFSLADRRSYAKVSYWADQLRSNGPENVTLVLVGNKSDLADQRRVSGEEARALAESLSAQYVETSALTGHGVSQAFLAVARQLLASPEFVERAAADARSHVAVGKSQPGSGGRGGCC